MKQQRIVRQQPPKQPQVIDARSPRATADGRATPVRTVMYVETGSMDADQVRALALEFAKQYDGPVHGPHYFVPVRNGRVRTDVHFEQEFLNVVRELCEVRQGEIVLKNGATAVQVSRVTVDQEGE